MTNFVKVSSFFPNQKLSLIVNRTDSESNYDIMKFQPKGILSYISDKGIHSKEPTYIKKTGEFIKEVQERQPSLVITPEGSIPFEVLKQIVNDKSKWPDLYKLWGLCMEGISKDDFVSLVEDYASDVRLKVVIENSITYRAHVNSLWYIFRIDDEHLCVVIQLKNNHMSDRLNEHEADHLTKGNTIYIFDLNNGEPTKNLLISLICADAIQIDASLLISEVRQSYPLIINPQCNEKPFDIRFKDSRNSIFSAKSIAKQRYIVANWAEGTKLENKFTIKESGNVYYNYLSVSGHTYFKKICSDKDFCLYRMKSQLFGVEYYGSSKFNIWNFSNEENVIRFFVKKDDVFNVDTTLSADFDPVIKENLIYSDVEKYWTNLTKKCVMDSVDGSKNIYISENKFLRPINYKQCAERGCFEKCFWLYNDYFFGICFGNDALSSELECIYEISNRTMTTLSSEGYRNSQRKRELFKELVELLEKNTIPEELPIFDNNLKFDIDLNAAVTGSDNIYNATVINVPEEYSNWGEKKGVFAIIDTDNLSEVEVIYTNLYKLINGDIRDQIVLYYRENGKYIIYNNPHKQSRISTKNTGFTKPMSSIFKGGMQYE